MDAIAGDGASRSQAAATARPSALALDAGAPPPPSMLDLPDNVLAALLDKLYPDGHALTAVTASCQGLRRLDTAARWRDWVVRRFGADALPAAPPAGPICVPEVPGFVFIQGLHPAAEPQSTLSERPLSDLAAAVREAQKAEAFTTDGRIFASVPPPGSSWRRWSLDPCDGTYLERSVAEALGFDTSQQPPVCDSWPPADAGGTEWLYFGGVDARPADGAAQNVLSPSRGDLGDVLRYAELAMMGCAAVTVPAGLALGARALKPQSAWRGRPRWGEGVFVRAAEAARLKLVLQETPSESQHAADMKLLYARLSAQAVEANDLDAVWLDDQHLALAKRAGRPAPPGVPREVGVPRDAVLKLQHVCWLEVSGVIRGVLPGRYQVAWCVDLTHVSLMDGDSVKLWAGVVPRNEEGQGGSGRGSGSATAPRQREAEATYNGRALKVLEQASRRAQQTFCWLRGPVIEVLPSEAPAAVRVRFYDHSSMWKSGIAWAFAQLLPVEPGDQQAALPPLAEPLGRGLFRTASGAPWGQQDADEGEEPGGNQQGVGGWALPVVGCNQQ